MTVATYVVNDGIIDARLTINGKPYFIMEKCDGSGRFYVVRTILIDRDGWSAETGSDERELILGQDIVETPLPYICLLFDESKHRNHEDEMKEQIDALRHIAILSNHDYVSYVPYAGSMTHRIFTREDGSILRITPRSFRSLQ